MAHTHTSVPSLCSPAYYKSSDARFYVILPAHVDLSLALSVCLQATKYAATQILVY